MISACRAAMFLSLASLTSCATVMDGHIQKVYVQTLKNGVESVDGSCVVSNKQGSWTVSTPGNVIVDRGRGKLNAACTAPGYRPGSIAVSSSMNRDLSGDMFVGGLVGDAVDVSSGAAYRYPSRIAVPMYPAPPQAPVAAVPAAPAKS